METVYVIALIFNSWDGCWDFYHNNKNLMTRAGVTCVLTEVPRQPVAPTQSLRPRMRPDDLMNKSE